MAAFSGAGCCFMAEAPLVKPFSYRSYWFIVVALSPHVEVQGGAFWGGFVTACHTDEGVVVVICCRLTVLAAATEQALGRAACSSPSRTRRAVT